MHTKLCLFDALATPPCSEATWRRLSSICASLLDGLSRSRLFQRFGSHHVIDRILPAAHDSQLRVQTFNVNEALLAH